ncbi:hemin uptake protein HemP [Kaustia mangrovi]|uniref:Hemin uptake protein HemP n=1 Tax=Kaustia mangrovi TaxID=2593653 RepID=A0A7S8C1V1_9HYPH|nr:hemin uptake protein HemP [Kaustia mangrovi]QPC41843.1 hemin uptake protein HemP [Kaustia mangrovi]
MTDKTPDRPADAASATAGTASDKPVLASQDILGGSRSAIILHEGESYILRVTRQGKLVLNK